MERTWWTDVTWPDGSSRSASSAVGDRLTGALAIVVVGVGVIRGLAGIVAWAVVRRQLAAERIRIPDGAERMAGQAVHGPLSAYEEAEYIRGIALKATGGKTYGELDEGDPMARMAMESSLLRSSLFTSVLAFGMAGAEMALGIVLVVIGAALLRIDRRVSPGPG